jgi:ribonuclease HI
MLNVYCDGSAHGFAGLPGGWAFVVLRDGQVLETGQGGAKKTTNNHMELEAAIAGLRCAQRLRRENEPISFTTDSRLTIDVARGLELPTRLEREALQLNDLSAALAAEARWVRGHAGDPWNEHVDALATEARVRFMSAKQQRRHHDARAKHPHE